MQFHAGAPLITSDHFKLGSLCGIDGRLRTLSAENNQALATLARLVMTELELHRQSRKLAAALKEVKTLSGLLPLWRYRKDVRDDQGCWKRVEEYVGDRTSAEFSHGLCPKCAKIRCPGIHLTSPEFRRWDPDNRKETKRRRIDPNFAPWRRCDPTQAQRAVGDSALTATTPAQGWQRR